MRLASELTSSQHCHSISQRDIQRQSTSLQGIIRAVSWTSLVDDNDCVHIFVTTILINHTNARDVFIKCSHRPTLRVVALDKAHIHIQHCTSFQIEIRALQVHFFAKIFGNQSRMKKPQMIAMTARLPKFYLAPLC